MPLPPWHYHDQPFALSKTNPPHSFVYRITLTDGRYYIGRKQFYSLNMVKVKGKTRRRKTIKESNWQTYTGSSPILNRILDEHGTGIIQSRTILHLCATKSDSCYLELQEQVRNIHDPMMLNYMVTLDTNKASLAKLMQEHGPLHS